MLNIVYISIITLCLVFIVTMIYIVISNNRHKKILEELTRYQIDVSANINEEIPALLESILKDSFDDYRIMYLEPSDQGYINSEREIEIRKEFSTFVGDRISEATMNKLSLFYNYNSIPAVIADKVCIMIMDYVIKHNNLLNS